MNFKKNQKVVFDNPRILNNLVMNVKRTYKSSGMSMVALELPDGIANAFASGLRLATKEEEETGFRQ